MLKYILKEQNENLLKPSAMCLNQVLIFYRGRIVAEDAVVFSLLSLFT